MLSAFQTTTYTVPGTNLSAERIVTCPNSLLLTGDPQHYELSYAGKTATTGFGGCLVAAATYNGLDVTAVILGCQDGVDRFAEAKNLFEWTFSNFGFRTLISSTDILETIPVAMGNPDSVGVRSDDSIQVLMPNDTEASDLTIDIVYQHELNGVELEAPINVGAYLGDATISLDGVERGTVRLVAASSVDVSRTDYLQTQLDVMLHNPSVRQIITILLAALGVYLLLVVFYLIQRLLHLHSLRRARRERARARSKEEIQWLDMPVGEEPDYLPEGEYAGDGAFTEEYPEEEPQEEFVEEEQPPEEFTQEEPAPEDQPEEPQPEGEAPEQAQPAPDEEADGGAPAGDGEGYADDEFDDEDFDDDEFDDGYDDEENPAYFDGDGEEYDDEPRGRR